MTERAAGPAIVDSKFELFVVDAEASARFYTALGFEVVERKKGGYTTVQSGTTVIALSPFSTWVPLRRMGLLRNPPLGTEIVLYSTDLDAHYQALLDAGFEPGPIKLQHWGHRDFRVKDYDGYYVRISEGGAV